MATFQELNDQFDYNVKAVSLWSERAYNESMLDIEEVTSACVMAESVNVHECSLFIEAATESLGQKLINAIKKIFEVLRKFIAGVFTKIISFLSGKKLEKDVEAAKEAVAQNPKLKNVKSKITDVKELEKLNEITKKKIREIEARMKKGKNVSKEELNAVKEFHVNRKKKALTATVVVASASALAVAGTILASNLKKKAAIQKEAEEREGAMLNLNGIRLKEMFSKGKDAEFNARFDAPLNQEDEETRKNRVAKDAQLHKSNREYEFTNKRNKDMSREEKADARKDKAVNGSKIINTPVEGNDKIFNTSSKTKVTKPVLNATAVDVAALNAEVSKTDAEIALEVIKGHHICLNDLNKAHEKFQSEKSAAIKENDIAIKQLKDAGKAKRYTAEQRDKDASRVKELQAENAGLKMTARDEEANYKHNRTEINNAIKAIQDKTGVKVNQYLG